MEVGVNSFLEIFNLGVVPERDDISVLYVKVQSMLLGEFVKFVLEILPVLDVSVQAENGPFLEVDWLVNKLVKNPGVV